MAPDDGVVKVIYGEVIYEEERVIYEEERVIYEKVKVIYEGMKVIYEEVKVIYDEVNAIYDYLDIRYIDKVSFVKIFDYHHNGYRSDLRNHLNR